MNMHVYVHYYVRQRQYTEASERRTKEIPDWICTVLFRTPGNCICTMAHAEAKGPKDSYSTELVSLF